MARDEPRLLARLLRMIRNLVRDALAAIEAGWRAGAPVDVTVVWRLELWWTTEADAFERDWPQVSDGVRARLRAALSALATEVEQVAVAGGGIDQLRPRLEVFRGRWEGWAAKVAATEATRIASEAVLTGTEAQRPGAWKEWVTSHDERVRSSHRLVDGERIPVAGSWMVGGWPMRYPGDPFGLPEEVIGCRCGIRIVNGKESGR